MTFDRTQPRAHSKEIYSALVPSPEFGWVWRDIGTMQLASAKRKAKKLGAESLRWAPHWSPKKLTISGF